MIYRNVKEKKSAVLLIMFLNPQQAVLQLITSELEKKTGKLKALFMLDVVQSLSFSRIWECITALNAERKCLLMKS